MTKIFKKRIINILAFILCITAFACCLTACDEPKDSNVEVTMSKSEITLDLYESATLTATVKNSDKAVVWASSDTSIVTVENGKLLALKSGEAIITATVEGKSAQCDVIVWASGAIPVLELQSDTMNIDLGSSLSINYSVRYKNVSVPATVTFESSNKQVATVSESGVVTGVATGTATVTVTVRYYTFETAKTVSVTII